jgi:1-acyl-sn-glycerol-3-phosphate acyltransferase
MIASFFKVLFLIFFTAVISSLEIAVVALNRADAFDGIMRYYMRTVLRVCGVNVVIRGLEKLDASRHYIYVSNHASLLDIPAVVAAIPDKIRIVYKKELNFIPVFGWAMKLTRMHIPIDRSRGLAAMRQLGDAVQRVITGASLLLFAEGTRSPDGNLQPFKRGAFNLAVGAGVAVVPVAIAGSYRVLPKHSFRITPGTITLNLDKAIEPTSSDGKTAESSVMEQTRSAIERLMGGTG